jgi:hypothetical protein
MGHVECVGETKSAYRILFKKGEEKGHLEDLGIDERRELRFEAVYRMESIGGTFRTW